MNLEETIKQQTKIENQSKKIIKIIWQIKI